MNRGEVWWVNFDPSIGGEVKKERPAIIVSNDVSIKFLNRVQVVPLSTKVQRLYPSEAYIQLRGRQNKAMADQLTTVSKSRLFRKAGKISAADMDAVDHAIRVQLGLVD